MTPSDEPADFDTRVSKLAALGEPVRRALYRFVASRPEPVSRDDVATGVGIPHHTAKFHLDKLEEEGLLEAEYKRPAGRGGPGAGRPAKLYRRSAVPVAVSLPERRYDLAGRIMAQAITSSRAAAEPVEQALEAAAREEGRRHAGSVRKRGDAIGGVCATLDDLGYEPRRHEDRITLENCPFHRLAQDYTDLVCTMNLCFVQGLTEPFAELSPRLDPHAGRCCVTIDN